ncbi:MAG: class I SAM-dependent methyltransferase [Rhodospirillaceae bacterium]
MAGSVVHGKVYTAEVLKPLFEAGLIRRVVDVGAGGGTYVKLLAPVAPGVYWIAVEAWTPYIADYALDRQYHEVINQDVREIEFAPSAPDLVLFGDILEHMTQEQALAVVGKALASAPYVMISIPIIDYPQHELEGNPFQRHVKEDWSHSEVCASFPDTVVTCLVHNSIGVYFLTRQQQARQRLIETHRRVAPAIKERFSKEIVIFGDTGS